MEVTEATKSDLIHAFGIAIWYIILSAWHTGLSRICDGLFSTFARYVLGSKPPSLLFFFHLGMFLRMTDLQQWAWAAWSLVTRDAPLEILEPKVQDLVIRGLLLVLYIVDALLFEHLHFLLRIISQHLLLLLALSMGVFVVSMAAAVIVKRLAVSVRLFLGAFASLAIAINKIGSNGIRLAVRGKDRIATAWAPVLERYGVWSPHLVYKYKDLESPTREIRLIKLQQTWFLTGPSCSLRSYRADEAPRYEAISYTWGSSNKDHLIMLDGRWLPTTANVHRILRDRASYFRTRYLWIDAVCINQDDYDERNAQVAIMGDVYRNAERVIVWLGDLDVNSSDVTKALHILEMLRFNIMNYRTYAKRIEPGLLLVGNLEMWEALGKLLGHSYWHRVWIVQEIAAGRKVHILYGGRYIAWDHLLKMVAPLTRDPGNLMVVTGLLTFRSDETYMARFSEGIAQITNIGVAKITLEQKDGLSLQSALAMTSVSVATDARDKVFALFNLIKPPSAKSEKTDISPNYAISVPELFIRTTRSLLPSDAIYVLQRAGVGWPRTFYDMPSWVPDWSATPMVSFEKNIPLGQRYKAGGGGMLETRLSVINASEICIDAVPLGIISSLSHSAFKGVLDSPDSMKGQRTFYEDAWRQVSTHLSEKYGQTIELVTEALWRTLIGNRYRINNSNPPAYARPATEEYAKFFQVWRGGSSSTADMSEDEAAHAYNSILNYGIPMAIACLHRKFALTKNGMMGLVPLDTKIGDMVVVVVGAPKPLLLRSTGSVKASEQSYQLVGDCYMHGLMDGQGLARNPVRHFTIC